MLELTNRTIFLLTALAFSAIDFQLNGKKIIVKNVRIIDAQFSKLKCRQTILSSIIPSYPWLRSCCTVCKRSLKLSNILPGTVILDNSQFSVLFRLRKQNNYYIFHPLALFLLRFCVLIRKTADRLLPRILCAINFQYGRRRVLFCVLPQSY